MLKANVANRTCERRRGSRNNTEQPIAKQTMAATSADTGWMLKAARFYWLLLPVDGLLSCRGD
jgi:hypothetical protein